MIETDVPLLFWADLEIPKLIESTKYDTLKLVDLAIRFLVTFDTKQI